MNAVRHSCYRDSRLRTVPLAIASRRRGGQHPQLQSVQQIITLNRYAEDVVRRLAPETVGVSRIPNFAPRQGIPGLINSSPRSGWLFVGRLTPEKGALWLAENWPAGMGRLTFIGDGPDSEKLKAIVDSRADLTFEGLVTGDRVLGYLAGAEGLILPSLWKEGIPTVALEALSTGTPIIVSRDCAAAEELTGREAAGRIIDMREGSMGLLNAMKSVQALSGSIHASARRIYETEFSEEVWLHRILRTYESAMRTS